METEGSFSVLLSQTELRKTLRKPLKTLSHRKTFRKTMRLKAKNGSKFGEKQFCEPFDRLSLASEERLGSELQKYFIYQN